MAITLSWVGGLSTNGDPNDASVAANWSPVQQPGSGDTLLLKDASTLDLAPSTGNPTINIQAATFSGAGNATLNFSTVTLDSASALSAAGTLTLNWGGSTVSAAQIAASASGAVVDLAIKPGGTVLQAGVMLASNGGSILISGSAGSQLQNENGALLALGGNLTIANTVTLDNTTGLLAVGQHATLDVAAAFSGGSQTVVFADATGTLKLDNPGGFTGRVLGFQTGDTIDLTNLAGLTQSFTNNVLSLSSGSTVVATLKFGGQALSAGNFSLLGDGGSGTKIVISNQADPLWAPPGADNSFNTGTNWSIGTAPGTGANVVIADSAVQKGTIVAASAESIGSLVMAVGTLLIGNRFALARSLSFSGGHIELQAGGTLTATTFIETGGGALQIDPGGEIVVSGGSGGNPGNGAAGFDFTGNAGTVTAGSLLQASGGGGNLVVGSNGFGSLSVQNSASAGSTVSVSDTVLGQYSNGAGSLAITGANTTYRDAGGDGTSIYSGAMLVGGGGFNSGGTLTTGGSGTLLVDQSASLTDASFALVGYTRTSTGRATVSNNAHWTINNPGSLPPSSAPATSAGGGEFDSVGALGVGVFGTGTLSVLSGGTLSVVGQPGTAYAVVIGQGSAANPVGTGSVTIDGSGSLLTANGDPLSVGQYGTGSLTVSNGGAVRVGQGPAADHFTFGLVVGSQVGAGNVASQGTVLVTGGALLADTSDLVVGRAGAAQLSVENGASLAVGGTLAVGGYGGTVDGFAASLAVGGGSATAAGLTLAGTGSIAVTGQGLLAIGTFGASPAAGELSIASGATLSGAGTVTVNSSVSAILNNGVVLASAPGGTLDLAANLQGSGTYEAGIAGQVAGAVLRVDGSVAAGTQISLGVSDQATLELTAPIGFQGTIDAFFGTGASADVLDLTTLSFANTNPQLSYAANADPTTGGKITVSSTANVYSFAVSGYHPGGFTLRSDGSNGGTAMVANDAAPCFVAGTRILTMAGEVAVEALAVGDLLPTLPAGVLRPVRWIGHTRIDLRRHPTPGLAAPVRIAAGAVGPGVPHRDLLVSPDHALAIGGALIPAHLLVNGASIRRIAADEVDYFHVELDRHAVLLAEGVAAESYLDTGNRGQFQGERGVRPLHPDMTHRPPHAAPCAPLLLEGAQVAAAQAALARRAAALGWRLTDDPGLRLFADRAPLALIAEAGGLCASIPPGTLQLRIASRSHLPAELDPVLADWRRLGVPIRTITLDGRPLDLAGATGIHPRAGAEAWCWTDGDATLALPAATAPAATAPAAASPAMLRLTLVDGLARAWLPPMPGSDLGRGWPPVRSVR